MNSKESIRKEVLKQLKNKNIFTIKVKDIADAIGISRSTFYLYYDSAIDVLQEMEDEYFKGLTEMNRRFWEYPLDVKYLEEPHPIIYEVLQYIKKNSELSVSLWGPNGDPYFQIKCQKYVTNNLLPKEMMMKYYPEDYDFQISFLSGGHIESLNQWTRHDFDISIARFAILTYRILYSDILSRTYMSSRH